MHEFIVCNLATCSRPVVFDAIMRVRTSTGVRPTDFFGAFYMVRIGHLLQVQERLEHHALFRRAIQPTWSLPRWTVTWPWPARSSMTTSWQTRMGFTFRWTLRVYLHLLKLFIYLQLLGINPLPLKSGSTSLHLLLWAEKTKNMQYVLERWVNMNSRPNKLSIL